MHKVIPDTASHVLSDAAAILALVESGERSLDDALDTSLAHPELRRTVSSLLFGYFRHKRLIDRWLSGLAVRPPRPRVRRLLAAALTQIRFQRGIAPEPAANVAVELAKARGGRGEAGFVNALLRRAVAAPPEMRESPDEVFPPELLARWRRSRSDAELAAMGRAFLAPAEFTFRAERGFEPPAEWAVEPVACRGPFRFFRSDDPGTVLRSGALREGKIYIQDPATALAASLPEMAEVRRVLDVCAAPGGKSLLLAERMRPEATLTAADRSARRQELTRENFCCRGLAFPVVVAEPRELTGSFDLVLADVPCSNTGVFRRRPDALWRFREDELPGITELQYEILEAAALRVAPGGQLVYSTCSIEPEENARQIGRFTAAHPEFEPVGGEQLLPSMEHDGAYAFLLRRSSRSIRR